uniref:Uncharacterized protein n=1 Tax=Cacopsylla melanoneura TaxID=428564 RepID=A0A8D9FBM6_9HEMI
MVKRGYGLRCSRPVSGLGPIFKAYLGEKKKNFGKVENYMLGTKEKPTHHIILKYLNFTGSAARTLTRRCSSQLFKRIRLGRQISRDSRMSSKYYDKSSLLNTLNCQRLNEEHIENLERK